MNIILTLSNYGKFNIRFAAVKVWNDLDEIPPPQNFQK